MIDKISIPNTAFIPCPKRQFNQVAAKHCPGCEFFNGLVDTTGSDQVAFENRYRVLCGHPIARRMARVEID